MQAAPIEFLREKIRCLEAADRQARAVHPFGVPEIDRRLPGGGLALGALHEVAGAGATGSAAASLFAAGIAARLPGRVLWCAGQADLFAPGLAAVGLGAERVVYAEAGSEPALLACFEEGLRHGGLAAVVAELARLPMTASRRLQLAAERSGTLALALRRADAAASQPAGGQPAGSQPAGGQPNAAATRWRVTPLPSAPLAVPGIGRPRWRLELLRCRGAAGSEGEAIFEVEACDHAGCLALPAGLADRPAARGRGFG